LHFSELVHKQKKNIAVMFCIIQINNKNNFQNMPTLVSEENSAFSGILWDYIRQCQIHQWKVINKTAAI